MIPETVFRRIEDYMPIPSVDVVILKDCEIIITKRTIRPYKGYWHLPGSIIQKNERAVAAARRSAMAELGIKVKVIKFINYYEMFSKSRHYISHLFVAKYTSGELHADFQSSKVMMVKPHTLPKHTIAIHKTMIKDAISSLRTEV